MDFLQDRRTAVNAIAVMIRSSDPTRRAGNGHQQLWAATPCRRIQQIDQRTIERYQAHHLPPV